MEVYPIKLLHALIENHEMRAKDLVKLPNKRRVAACVMNMLAFIVIPDWRFLSGEDATIGLSHFISLSRTSAITHVATAIKRMAG